MKKLLCFTIITMMILSSIMTVSAEEAKWTVKPQYDEIIGGDETGTIICVSKDGKFGYIDNNGKVLVDFQFDKADIFSEGLAFVEKDGIKGFIDKTGKMVFDTHSSKYFYDEEADFYHTCEKFSNGFAKIYIDNWNRTFIDKDGNTVDDYAYNNILDFVIESNIVTVSMQNGVTYYNLDTKMKLEGDYINTAEFSEGYGAVVKYSPEKEKSFLYILDKDFKVTAKDLEYNKFLNQFTKFNNSYIDLSVGYKNGYLVVGNEHYDEHSYNIKYGLIDTKGKEIIPISYDGLSVYSDKLLAATIKEKSGYIDINNKWVIKPVYNKAGDFKNGIAIVSEDFNEELWKGTFGIINNKGEYIIKPTFSNIIFDEKSDLIYAMANGKWGILNISNTNQSQEANNQTLPDDKPDSWAKDEVNKAIEKNLVPDKLLSKYKERITRGEFCDLAISLVESKLNMSIGDIMTKKGLTYNDNPFSDTKENNIIAANKLGIVNGKSNGKFDPNGYITRQEAAVMLANASKAFDVNTTANTSSFADENLIASWAKSAVDYVSSIDVMKGTNNGFEPTANYTRQQAYITILRLFNKIELKDNVINPYDYDVSGIVVDEFGNTMSGVEVNLLVLSKMVDGARGKYPYYDGIDKIKTDENGIYAFNIPDKSKEYKINAKEIILDNVAYKQSYDIKNASDSKKIVMHRVYSVEVTTVDMEGNNLKGDISVKIVSNVNFGEDGEAIQISSATSSDASEKIIILYNVDNKIVTNPVTYVECNGLKGEVAFTIEKGDYKIKRITIIVK